MNERDVKRQQVETALGELLTARYEMRKQLAEMDYEISMHSIELAALQGDD